MEEKIKLKAAAENMVDLPSKNRFRGARPSVGAALVWCGIALAAAQGSASAETSVEPFRQLVGAGYLGDHTHVLETLRLREPILNRAWRKIKETYSTKTGGVFILQEEGLSSELPLLQGASVSLYQKTGGLADGGQVVLRGVDKGNCLKPADLAKVWGKPLANSYDERIVHPSDSASSGILMFKGVGLKVWSAEAYLSKAGCVRYIAVRG